MINGIFSIGALYAPTAFHTVCGSDNRMWLRCVKNLQDKEEPSAA